MIRIIISSRFNDNASLEPLSIVTAIKSELLSLSSVVASGVELLHLFPLLVFEVAQLLEEL